MNVHNAAAAGDDYIREVMRAAEGEKAATVGRRSFLKLAGVAGGGLVLGLALPRPRAAANGNGASAAPPAAFAPNPFLQITPDGTVLIYAPNPEVGQGVKTSLPMVVAEELNVDWSQVRVQQSIIDARYGRQVAGGSRSVPTTWDPLRRAGAVARTMLVAAAAKEWGVRPAECFAQNGVVTHEGTARKLGYGALASKAALLPVPDDKSVTLKERRDYRLLGKRITGVDNHSIVTGRPLYGIDQKIPGMLYASFLKCPAVGGRVKSANLDAIRALPGVKNAFVVEGTGKATEVMPGVAIIATSTWAALEAKKQLKVEWDETSASKDSWSGASKRAKELASTQGPDKLRTTGDVDAAFAGAAHKVEAFYTYPFVAHAPLEPQNCTAHYKNDGSVEIWAPTQMPQAAVKLVSTLVGVPEDRVTLHQTRVGGGFGRRLINDFVCEAAQISKQAGAPIKLQWSREDDMAHDFYRVGGFHSLAGALDGAGKVIAFQDHFVTFSADGQRPVPGGDMTPEEFPAPVLPNVRLTQTKLPLMIPCGPWRAPRSNALGFAIQSFLHELSSTAGRDHLEFLLELMGEPRWLPPATEFALHTGRAAAVIRLAAEKAGWGKKLPPGSGMGLAFYFSHAGHFAEVAEVSVDAAKKLTVHRVTVAADIGPIINLSGAENQCEGAVIDGLSTMMGLGLSIENGRIEEQNFDTYPLLRINNAPRVEAHFIQSEYPPTGCGEPALPPVAPAICNAIFAAMGHRVRTLPLTREGFSI